MDSEEIEIIIPLTNKTFMKTYFVKIRETYQKSIVVSVNAESIDDAKSYALNNSPNPLWEEDLFIEKRNIEDIYSEEQWKQFQGNEKLQTEIIEAYMDKNDLDIVPEYIPVSFIKEYKSQLK